MTIPIISDILEKFFGPNEDIHSRDDVKRRLQIVLAHDRLALDPQTLEMMRQEIIAVVSRYVEVDFESLEFSLATDQRVTALTANLPIRRIRPLGRGADQPIAADDEVKNIELASQSEIMALDAEDAEAALRRFEAESINAQNPHLIHAPLDIERDEDFSEKEDDELALSEPLAATAEGNVLDQAEATDSTNVVADGSSAESFSGDDVPDVPDMSIPDVTVPSIEGTDKNA
ncbi:MAG: cell division topological specificity factor MinE [Cyanobacteria bacterium J06597_16]